MTVSHPAADNPKYMPAAMSVNPFTNRNPLSLWIHCYV